MAATAEVAARIEGYVTQLQQEGVLDEQFRQLMQLQDETNPDFVTEVVQLFFEDSASKIERIGVMLSAPDPDFTELDHLVHQFKGSSASLGARMIEQLCIRLREMCGAQNSPACVMLLGQVQQCYDLLKTKLEVFMQLEARHKQLQQQEGGHQ